MYLLISVCLNVSGGSLDDASDGNNDRTQFDPYYTVGNYYDLTMVLVCMKYVYRCRECNNPYYTDHPELDRSKFSCLFCGGRVVRHCVSG